MSVLDKQIIPIVFLNISHDCNLCWSIISKASYCYCYLCGWYYDLWLLAKNCLKCSIDLKRLCQIATPGYTVLVYQWMVCTVV